jgi:hypothetical protein
MELVGRNLDFSVFAASSEASPIDVWMPREGE